MPFEVYSAHVFNNSFGRVQFFTFAGPLNKGGVLGFFGAPPLIHDCGIIIHSRTTIFMALELPPLNINAKEKNPGTPP